MSVTWDRLVDERAFATVCENFLKLCGTDNEIFPAFSSTTFMTRDHFNNLLLLYVENVHQVLPVLHIPTVDFQKAHWLLSLAVATLGCQFLIMEHAEGALVSLLEFLRRAVMYCSRRLGTDVTLLEYSQARLMLSIGLAYTGNDSKLAQAKHSLDHDDFLGSSDWSKAGLVQHQRPLPQEIGALTVAWYRWRNIETIRRTGYCIWLFDCMFAYHHQLRPQLLLDIGSIPLPCSELLWGMHSAPAWREMVELTPPTPTLTSALGRLYAEKVVQSTMGELSRIILIHGLIHRLWEVKSHLEHPLTWWVPEEKTATIDEVVPQTVWLPEVPMYYKWRDSTCDALEVLHWSAMKLVGTAGGIEYPTVVHLHLSRIILLVPIDDIRNLANALTRSDCDLAAVTKLREKVQRWLNDEGARTRLAMVHAGAIFWHLRHFSANAFYEPHAAFIASLALWSYSSLPVDSPMQSATPTNGLLDWNGTTVQPDLELHKTNVKPSPLTVIHLDRPADRELVQLFVELGENMSALLDRVGDVRTTAGSSRVLEEGIRLLSTLKHWGCHRKLAQRLRMLRG